VAEPSIPPCVLVVADGDRIAELVDALSELHGVDVLVSSGGDDTIELFEARRPVVVVLTASLELGDTKALIITLRSMVPRGEVAIVVIGDDAGPIRTALDALDLAPDRFVTRPLSSKALRFAVTGGIDAVRVVRGAPAPPRPMLPVAVGTAPRGIELSRVAMHAIRRNTPNSSITAIMPLPVSEAVAAASAAIPPDSKPAVIPPEPSKPTTIPRDSSRPTTIPREPSRPIAVAREPSRPIPIAPEPPAPTAMPREPSTPTPLAREPSTPIALAREPSTPIAIARESSRPTAAALEASTSATRAAMRARWEALADSIADGDDEADLDEREQRAERTSRVTEPVDPAELAALAERASRPTDPGDRDTAVPEPPQAAASPVPMAAGRRPPSEPGDEPPPLPPPLLIKPRRRQTEPAEGAESAELADASEPLGADVPAGAGQSARAGGSARAIDSVRLAAFVRSVDAARAVEAVRPLEGPERMDPARAAEAAGLIKSAGLAESARSSESALSRESARSSDATRSSEVRSSESARSSDAVRSSESALSSESARSSDAVRSSDASRSSDAARSSEVRASDVVRSSEARSSESARSREARSSESALASEPDRSSESVEVAPPERPTPVGYPDSLEPGELFDAELGDAAAPPREPTLILREPEPAVPAESRTRTGDGRVVVAARTSSHEFWSEPMPIDALSDRELAPDLEGRPAPPRDVLDFDDLDTGTREPRSPRSEELDDLPDVPLEALASPASETPAPDGEGGEAAEPRDFARELRAKMSLMAQRLFQGGDAAGAVPSDHGPRHDHHTEIDLAALGSAPPLGAPGELEPPAQRHEVREITTSPGSWDTQVRERGLPDTGALVRGVSDAAMLLARMFAQGATGRVAFRRDDVEAVVFFDRGRPVFASSNEPSDRMGELLLREGKITASQYERCQTVVAESGRRMGEILVDFGYLKRRELLPAVRRHVEDIIYSLFAWERGSYAILHDSEPCAERIRLSRHAASLILEGIRRKLDRTTLERLIGSTTTVIEVRDRERLGGIVHLGDLAAEERAALAAFDGQADLAHVAVTAGVNVADVLPLAWGLCVLGLAIARRTDAELPDESAALVGETDLAIDRERVRARWQLVGEADYFALLGVRRDATGFEIRRAYQSARRDFAADCFPGDLRRELARELDDIAHVLDEAFRVLRDDRLRQTYLANLVDP
jgi:hypothetical protein